MLSPYPDAALLRRSDVGLVGRHPHRNYRRADKSGKMYKSAEDRQRQLALGGTVELTPYSKMLIASQLGMKPETLSRAFAKLRDHGVQIDATMAHIKDVAHLRDIVAEGQT